MAEMFIWQNVFLLMLVIQSDLAHEVFEFTNTNFGIGY